MVACEHSDEPRYVLGAMLPDFGSMAAARIDAVLDADVARGVALHHETDRRFHSAAPFRAACASALAVLEPQGVGRPTARAVGHVGCELLLDGLLSSDERACRAYETAVRVAVDERLERGVAWKGEGDADRLRALLQRLRTAPLPGAYRDVDFVCDRLAALLSRRPRLAMQPGDLRPVRAWLADAARDLAPQCDALLRAVR